MTGSVSAKVSGFCALVTSPAGLVFWVAGGRWFRGQKPQKAPKSATERRGLLGLLEKGGALWDFWGTFGGTTVLLGALAKKLVVGG